MKVITEEKLNAYLDDNLSSCCECGNIDNYDDLKHQISGLFEYIDTLTVSKLRPMCDTKAGDSVLVVFNGGSAFYAAYIKTNKFLMIDDEQFGIDLFTGWIPVPIYEPEQK